MKQFSTIITCCILAFLFCYCQPKQNTSKTGADIPVSTVPDMHNAQTSLDWAGTYKGIVPCADCEGIETTIILYEDLSYSISRRYLHKEERTFKEEGTFFWNEAGSTIQLSTDDGQYFVGENTLFHLDEEGNRITGDLAEHYMLKKVNGESLTPSAITETYWKLVVIDGKPVATPDGGKEVYFTLFPEENSIRGFAGCNGFGGGYNMEGNNQIAFSQLFSTKMACPNLDTENEFMKALEATRSFKIENNALWLIDASQNPIAKFEASNK